MKDAKLKVNKSMTIIWNEGMWSETTRNLILHVMFVVKVVWNKGNTMNVIGVVACIIARGKIEGR